MTDHHFDEQVLAGVDGPRPLPAALRQRLEDSLLARDPRSLGPDLAGRLSDALTQPPPGRPPRPPRRWSPARTRVAAGAVAAGLLIAGGTALAVDHAGPSHPAVSAPAAGPAASGPAGSAAASAGPSATAGRHAPTFGATPKRASTFEGNAAAGSPSVIGVSPAHGPAAGGTWVTLTGPGLGAVTAVRFGGVPAPRTVVVSSTEVRALTPPHPAGAVTVTVAAASGARRAAPFTYAGP